MDRHRKPNQSDTPAQADAFMHFAFKQKRLLQFRKPKARYRRRQICRRTGYRKDDAVMFLSREPLRLLVMDYFSWQANRRHDWSKPFLGCQLRFARQTPGSLRTSQFQFTPILSDYLNPETRSRFTSFSASVSSEKFS
jgi:hypothetical protein